MACCAVPSVRPVSWQMVSQDAHNEIALLLRFSRSCPARKLLAARGRWRDEMANMSLAGSIIRSSVIFEDWSSCPLRSSRLIVSKPCGKRGHVDDAVKHGEHLPAKVRHFA